MTAKPVKPSAPSSSKRPTKARAEQQTSPRETTPKPRPQAPPKATSAPPPKPSEPSKPSKASGVTVAGVLLYSGAGTNAQHPALVALEDALRAEFVDLVVQRVDFPYRREGRKLPDRAPKLVAAVHDEVNAFAESLGVSTASLVIGGRSMGGRMCSMAIADGLQVAGLLCMSYPLHPPKKPEKLRIEHFPGIRVPSLFISGSRDDFGTPDELRMHINTIPVPSEIVILEGKGHDLANADEIIAEHTINWLQRLPRLRP